MAFCSGNDVSNATVSNLVEDNQNWMRLTLANNVYGTQSITDLMHNELKFTNNKQEFHLWIANAKKKGKKGSIKNVTPFVGQVLQKVCANRRTEKQTSTSQT